MKFIPMILMLVLFVCCKNTDTMKQIDQEIASLTIVEKQTQFLEDIFSKDQEVRHFETEQLEKFGHDSKEHQLAVQKWMEADEQNLLKIEAYLKTYGHPILKKHGKNAFRTPFIVIHHAQGGVEPRKRNFPYLFKAYKQGDLDGEELSFFLNRMYDKQFGRRIKWDKPYRLEEELDTLFKSLDLVEVVREIDSKKESK